MTNRLANLTPRHSRGACRCTYRPMDFPDPDGRLPMLRVRSDDCPRHLPQHREDRR